MIRVWDKEKIRVPDKNRTHNLPNSGWAFYPMVMRTHGEQGHLTEFTCDRCPVYCSSYNIVIRTVKVIVSSNKRIKMVNLSLVDRVPTQCLRSHGFNSCQGVRVFSLSHTHVMLINSPFTFCYQA